ncbi:MAG: hypothetical protein ACRBBN_21955 [Methyloligellaceae bacterium]
MIRQITTILKFVVLMSAASMVAGCVVSQDSSGETMKLTAKEKKAKKKRSKNDPGLVVVHKALPKKRKHRYFVEFRSRPNGVTSHSYIAYGRLYNSGRTRRVKLVGLHPKNGSAGFLIGSVVGMEAQLKPVWGDLNVPHTVSFRVPITTKQYRNIVAFVKNEQKQTHTWNLLLNNCNGFVGRVAELVGLNSPTVTAVPPSSYVETLIEKNT